MQDLSVEAGATANAPNTFVEHSIFRRSRARKAIRYRFLAGRIDPEQRSAA
jgi:hypothetical protein